MPFFQYGGLIKSHVSIVYYLLRLKAPESISFHIYVKTQEYDFLDSESNLLSLIW